MRFDSLGSAVAMKPLNSESAHCTANVAAVSLLNK